MIQWNEEIAEAMAQHAASAYPYECCGFLLGEETAGKVTVLELLPVDNTHGGERRRRFFIEPVSYMRAERTAIQKGLQLVGVYHSHPDHPAIPSEEDRTHALAGFRYPIVSVQKGKTAETRSWQLGEDRLFQEEKLTVNQLKTSN